MSACNFRDIFPMFRCVFGQHPGETKVAHITFVFSAISFAESEIGGQVTSTYIIPQKVSELFLYNIGNFSESKNQISSSNNRFHKQLNSKVGSLQ